MVVARQNGVTLDTPAGAPLPVLRIALPAQPDVELPNLTDSWAWAHAQVAGEDSTAQKITDALGQGPELSLSRLVCPRILSPQTDYLACVVPTFELGRLTGLGHAVSEDALKAPGALAPAWLSGDAAPKDLSLPVYYSWAFRTGEGGDFETLARGLTPDTPAGLGLRDVDISKPGFDAGGATKTALQGALRPVQLLDPDGKPAVDAPPPPAFQTNLAAILNAPGKAEATPGVDPVLAPPIYGRWHAAAPIVTAPAGAG